MVPGAPPGHPDPLQPTLFDAADPPVAAPRADPIGDRLRALDPDRMTPLDALTELAKLRREAAEDEREG
jgi:hypothetical protein